MKIAIIGTFQTGKSTLVNCLIDDSIADVGSGLSTTHSINVFQAGPDEVAFLDHNQECISKLTTAEYRNLPQAPEKCTRVRFSLQNWKYGDETRICDTPGFDATGKDASWDTTLTKSIVETADAFILLLPNKAMDSFMKETLRSLRKTNKPIFIVMNCLEGNDTDPLSPRNQETVEAIVAEAKNCGVLPCVFDGDKRVLSYNAAWYWIGSLTDEFHAYNQRNQEIFTTKYYDVLGYFQLRGKEFPGFEELQRMSNLSSLREILQDPAKLKAACERYRIENPPLPEPKILVPEDEFDLLKAIDRVMENGTITIAPGTYRLDKPIEINKTFNMVGRTGERKDVQIVYGGRGTNDNFDGFVIIRSGSPQVSNCTISGNQLNGIANRSYGTPVIENCIIRDSRCGIVVFDGCGGRFLRCNIRAMDKNGVLIHSKAAPNFGECKIFKCEGNGVRINSNGEGTFWDCRIYKNKDNGASVGKWASPYFSDCAFYKNWSENIYEHPDSEGEYENCENYEEEERDDREDYPVRNPGAGDLIGDVMDRVRNFLRDWF